VQARGGGGETAAIGHHDNGAQQVEVEQGSIRFHADGHLVIQLSNGKTDFYHA
jgi:hypothetical protein